MAAPRGARPPRREKGEIKALEGLIGSASETAILEQWQSHLHLARSNAQIIAGPDFTNCDFGILDVNQAGLRRPFPSHTHLRSYERLEWAWEHRDICEVVLCDVKTGPPTVNWQRNRTSVYLTQITSLSNGRLYAIPHDRAQFICGQIWSRKRMDSRRGMLFSNPVLAPYAVFPEEYVALFEQLVGIGKDVEYSSPVLDSGLLAGYKKVKLRQLFQFLPTHEQSFRCVLALYLLLRKHHPELQFERVLNQPLGGDFTLVSGGRRFTIQHKIKSTHDVGLWFQPPAYFHFLFHQTSTEAGSHELDGPLTIYYDVTKCKKFNCDASGARSIVKYLHDSADAAEQRLFGAMVRIIHEEPGPARAAEASVTSGETPRKVAEEYNTFRKRGHQLSLLFCDFVNKDLNNLNLPVACTYLNWDQTHCYGEVYFDLYPWTAEERNNSREHDILPSSLEAAPRLAAGGQGIVLRFCCRDHRNRKLESQHLPLQQRGAELPVTPQKYFLLAAPDGSMSEEMPTSMLFLPSGFITYPADVLKEWGEKKKQDFPIFTLSLLYGHIKGGNNLNFNMAPGVKLCNFWLTPESIVKQLHQFLQGSGAMSVSHPEVRSQPATFKVEDYLTDSHTVLRAPLVHGMIRDGDGKHKRSQGYYGIEQHRQAKAQGRLKGEEVEEE